MDLAIEDPCEGDLRIEGESIRMVLPRDSLANLGVTGYDSLPLFMIDKAELRISFVHSQTEQAYSINTEINATLSQSPPPPSTFQSA